MHFKNARSILHVLCNGGGAFLGEKNHSFSIRMLLFHPINHSFLILVPTGEIPAEKEENFKYFFFPFLLSTQHGTSLCLRIWGKENERKNTENSFEINEILDGEILPVALRKKSN